MKNGIYNKEQEATITASYANEKLRYDPNSGSLTWAVKIGSRKIGQSAGYIDSLGYRRVALGGILFYAHRVIWLMVTGKWPQDQIDHKDRCRSNNKWLNLRPATFSQNRMNSKKPITNTSGAKGVYRIKNGKFIAYANPRKGKVIFGIFDTLEEAKIVYSKRIKDVYGEFARVE